jgi:hypothetical protein
MYTGSKNITITMPIKKAIIAIMLLTLSSSAFNQDSIIKIKSFHENEAGFIGGCQATFIAAHHLTEQAYAKMTALKIVIPPEKLVELSDYQDKMAANFKVFNEYFKKKNMSQAGMDNLKWKNVQEAKSNAFKTQMERYQQVMNSDHLTDIEKASYENAYSLNPAIIRCVRWYKEDIDPKGSI